jgi:hypothetical protein
MSNKVVVRIKSAAFIRRKHWNGSEPALPASSNHIIADLPVSESIFMSKVKERPSAAVKTQSMSKLALSRFSPSTSSEIWRKVHSTRSEVRLKSLNGSKVEEEPVRLNLMEKVDRIKSKHTEREKVYEKNCFLTERIIKQRCSSLKKKGEKGDIERKIHELLAPFERASKLAE